MVVKGYLNNVRTTALLVREGFHNVDLRLEWIRLTITCISHLCQSYFQRKPPIILIETSQSQPSWQPIIIDSGYTFFLIPKN